MTIKTWDPSEYLESTEDMLAYLDEAARSGDPALLQAAVRDIARAKGTADVQIAVTPKPHVA